MVEFEKLNRLVAKDTSKQSHKLYIKTLVTLEDLQNESIEREKAAIQPMPVHSIPSDNESARIIASTRPISRNFAKTQRHLIPSRKTKPHHVHEKSVMKSLDPMDRFSADSWLLKKMMRGLRLLDAVDGLPRILRKVFSSTLKRSSRRVERDLQTGVNRSRFWRN